MVTGVFCQIQVTIKIRLNDYLRMIAGCTYHDSYALLVEYVLSSPSHSASDDDVCPFVVQPAGKQARLMRRRIGQTRTKDLPVRSIRLEQGKLFAVTEVCAQPAACDRYRDDDICVLIFLRRQHQIILLAERGVIPRGFV